MEFSLEETQAVEPVRSGVPVSGSPAGYTCVSHVRTPFSTSSRRPAFWCEHVLRAEPSLVHLSIWQAPRLCVQYVAVAELGKLKAVSPRSKPGVSWFPRDCLHSSPCTCLLGG